MGTDIHAHVEILVDDDWLYYGKMTIDRNYTLFARLAGVRNYYSVESMITKPRGLPEDVTWTTELMKCAWQGSEHNTTWITSQEYKEVSEWMHEQQDNPYAFGGLQHNRYPQLYLFGNGFYAFTLGRFKADYPAWLQDFRVIFWFDS